jgi:hypothetical protein
LAPFKMRPTYAASWGARGSPREKLAATPHRGAIRAVAPGPRLPCLEGPDARRAAAASDPDAERSGAVLLRHGDQQRLDPEAHPDGVPRHWGLKEISLRTYRTRGLGVKTGSEEINPRLAFRPAMTYLGLGPDHAATAQGLLDRYSATMLQGPTLRTNR